VFSKTLVRTLTFLVAILVFAATIGFGFTLGFKYVISQNDRFERFEDTVKVIDKDNPDAVMIVIRQGFNTSDIADALMEAELSRTNLPMSLCPSSTDLTGSIWQVLILSERP
jgi:hypothetical protein